MGEVSKEKATVNFIWRLLERTGAQIVSFVVSLVLARLLEPSAYGDVALVTVISSILQVFVDSGMANALIQKKDADDIDFSTVFYFNLLFCLILYIGVYIFAPVISSIYGKDLTAVIRVLCLIIVISGVKNVQQAYVSRNMIFKKFFYATLIGTIVSAGAGIALAYKGYGVWALVAQQLINPAIDTLVLWITVKWRPTKKFSFDRFKILFSFGWKLLLAQLIDSLYENCRSLIIGKKYSSDALAYYNKGKQFPALILTNVTSSMDSVLFPTLSSVQDKKDRVTSMLSRGIKLSTYIVFPLMIGLAVVGRPLITLLLTEKWLPCVQYMQIFCIAMIFTPISLSNLNAIKALGDSKTYLKLEITRKVFGITTLMILMWFGPTYIAISYLLNNIFGYIVNTCASKRLINYGPKEQMKDILPSLVCSVIMAALVYSLTFMINNELLLISLQVIVGGISYLLVSKLTHNENYFYIVDMVNRFLKR